MTEYITQVDYRRQKRALAAAQRAPEAERRAAVEATVLATLREWDGKAWPDDWARWERALNDTRSWRDQVSLNEFYRAALTAEAQAKDAARRAEAERIAALYPEHQRLSAVSDHSQAIGEFLEWLQGEQGYSICEWTDAEYAEGRYHPLHRTIESWLAQYFQIDPVKIEREKRAMLDAMRALSDDEVERV